MLVRGIVLTMVGLGVSLQGLLSYGKEPSAAERTAWLFQRFGPNGLSMGMLVMGMAFIVLGVTFTVRSIARLRDGRRKTM